MLLNVHYQVLKFCQLSIVQLIKASLLDLICLIIG